MPKKPFPAPVKQPAVKKAARKTIVKKTVRKTVAKKTVKKPAAAKPQTQKRSRTEVINEHPGNLAADEHDHTTISSRRSTVDRIGDPPSDQLPVASMVARVSDAIERELSKIECIVGNPSRRDPAQRIETESRARVLASLARTLKEVMRLREQEHGAGEDKAKAADDDAIPRDLDEFRRELSRRLEGLVEGAAPFSDRGDEPG